MTLAEISRIRQAIVDGTLWELVDERCRGHPQLLSGYRALLGHAPSLELHDRVTKRRFFYRGDESCGRTEVLHYQQMLSRLRIEDTVLVSFDGKEGEGFKETLLFRPPFGPYPRELRETFPVGPSEVPEWDDAMVRQGCRGIRSLCETHPDSRIAVSCKVRWGPVVRQELGAIEVRHDTV